MRLIVIIIKQYGKNNKNNTICVYEANTLNPPAPQPAQTQPAPHPAQPAQHLQPPQTQPAQVIMIITANRKATTDLPAIISYYTHA